MIAGMYDGQMYDAYGYGEYHARPDGSVWLPRISDEDYTKHETRVAYYEPLGDLLPWQLCHPTCDRPVRRNGAPLEGLRWAVAEDLPPDQPFSAA
ncbi:hypothetical protein [Gandjariella thermophila]|uniref:Uncharacterized protein n=1 Tax=Gandjariella thermophila TaxID=1931992 RepID=A0A4D4IWQ2_9PSEU|nr:hypothetical protein [Gandjariella thermophila]GDY28775.1 hypothetical protein GTS_04080 [Gandjariella thermophila]